MIRFTKSVTSQLLLATSLLASPAVFAEVDQAPVTAPKVEEKKAKEIKKAKAKGGKIHDKLKASKDSKSTKVDAALEKMPHNQEKTEQPAEQKVGE